MQFAGFSMYKLLILVYMSSLGLALVEQVPEKNSEKLHTVDLNPVSATRSWTRYARRFAYIERSFRCCLMGRTAAKIGYFCDFDTQASYLRVNEEHFHRVKTEVWRRTPRLMTSRIFRQCRNHSHRYRKCCEDESEYIDRFIEQKRSELKWSTQNKAHSTDPPIISTAANNKEVLIRIHPHDKEP